MLVHLCSCLKGNVANECTGHRSYMPGWKVLAVLLHAYMYYFFTKKKPMDMQSICWTTLQWWLKSRYQRLIGEVYQNAKL